MVQKKGGGGFKILIIINTNLVSLICEDCSVMIMPMLCPQGSVFMTYNYEEVSSSFKVIMHFKNYNNEK